MFKKTALGIAAAAAITVGALAGTASTAQAGNVNWGFSFGNGDFSVGVGHGGGWGGGWGGNPCYKYKKKWKKAKSWGARKYWKNRYYDCLDYY